MTDVELLYVMFEHARALRKLDIISDLTLAEDALSTKAGIPLEITPQMLLSAQEDAKTAKTVMEGYAVCRQEVMRRAYAQGDMAQDGAGDEEQNSRG